MGGGTGGHHSWHQDGEGSGEQAAGQAGQTVGRGCRVEAGIVTDQPAIYRGPEWRRNMTVHFSVTRGYIMAEIRYIKGWDKN